MRERTLTEPVLIFDGIDMFADVYLNGNIIGPADNMFITYEFKAEGIKKGTNELVVHIKPTVDRGTKI